jgi:hypothetical protein
MITHYFRLANNFSSIKAKNFVNDLKCEAKNQEGEELSEDVV